MSDLTLNFDKKAAYNIDKLKKHYGVKSRVEIIRKALALLTVAVEIDNTGGQLIAKKGNKQARIVLRKNSESNQCLHFLT